MPVGDRSKLTGALSRLWTDRETTRRMGEKNRRLAEAFTWDRYIDLLLNIYDDVLKEQANDR